MSERTMLPLRLTGAVWGHLVGDAMGVPYEFRPPERIGEVRWDEPNRGIHGKPPGTWSDDGALMLALLDSLVTAGFDTEDQGRRALAWRRTGAYTPEGNADGVFDIGTTTVQALSSIEAGTPAEEAGPTGERSQSNGSLMRILPIALWGAATKLPPGDLVAFAMRASRVTHGHPVPQVTCAVYALVARELLAGTAPARALSRAIDRVRAAVAGDPALAPALEAFVDWPKSHQPEGRGGALNAFWSAWTAFRGARSYRGTIERAIRYGNDTDTTAAIAGGLAGIRWGIDGIPVGWRRGMRGREVVAPIIDRLMHLPGWKTSTTHPIRVDWVDLSTVPGLKDATGRLGMTFLPGKQYVGWHGPTWRDLELDVARLRTEFGCDRFVLLVEDHELVATRTAGLAAVVQAAGIELIRHPIVDMWVAADRAAYRQLLDDQRAAIADGRTVVVACRGGLGRTGTAVACLLVDAGMKADQAIDLTRASRRNTIERGVQVQFVRDWARPRRSAAR